MIFTVTVDRDEDGVWIVECPSIPGCVTQGNTKDEALENIKDAIKLCLQVRGEQGLPLTIETNRLRWQPDGVLANTQREGSSQNISNVRLGTREAEQQPYDYDEGWRNRDIVDTNHKHVAKGTLRSLIRAANLTVEEFVKSK